MSEQVVMISSIKIHTRKHVFILRHSFCISTFQRGFLLLLGFVTWNFYFCKNLMYGNSILIGIISLNSKNQTTFWIILFLPFKNIYGYIIFLNVLKLREFAHNLLYKWKMATKTYFIKDPLIFLRFSLTSGGRVNKWSLSANGIFLMSSLISFLWQHHNC